VEVKEILKSNDREKTRALFAFSIKDSNELILFKYNLFVRFFFPKYFKEEDAPFHADIDSNNLKVYKGEIASFTDVVYRGGAKTTRTKLFVAFCVANDKDSFRRYFKILTKDLSNSKQSVTDIYNMFVDSRVRYFYPEVFAKTEAKKQETMEVFDTATGIKVRADSVGTDQRGQLQEAARPDFIWFDDFETRKTLRSAVETKALWDNMEEARTGLSRNGGCVYTCNYLSERGNVHKLILKKNKDNVVLIVPIIKDGIPTWAIYSLGDIEKLRLNTDDFEGEYLCKPSASLDVIFDRATLDLMFSKEPVKEVAGFRMYKDYDASHRYGSGQDVGGGVGLDSSTSCFIDFDIAPAQVVGTYDNNEVRPEVFGDEIARQGERFGESIVAPENNKFDIVIGRLRQIYPEDKIYKTQRKSTKVKSGEYTDYGWNTNALTKPKMFYALAKAVEDGLLILNDPKLIAEAKSYTRDDVMDKDIDPRLTTRHFDLLTACAIAWQMKDFAEAPKEKQAEEVRIEQNRHERKQTQDVGLS